MSETYHADLEFPPCPLCGRIMHLECRGHRYEVSTFQNEQGEWEVWGRLTDRPMSKEQWFRVEGSLPH